MIRILSIFFNLLYHSFAGSYDAVSWLVSGGRWKDWVRSVLPLIEGETVLELGCGTGTLQVELLKCGIKAFALDESGNMLRIANKKLASNGVSTAARLLRARAEAIPLPTASFDCLVATFPSEYIFRLETLIHCRRVLKPGGKLIILLGGRITGGGIYNQFLRFLYLITGQSTPDIPRMQQIKVRVESMGFQMQIEQIDLEQDRLTVMVAM